MTKQGVGAGAADRDRRDSAELGGTVRAQREQRHLTIASLARKVGVSAAAISQIESGAVQPSVATLRRLAAALEIPVFRLFLPVEAEAVSVVRRADRVSIVRPSSGDRDERGERGERGKRGERGERGARFELLSPSTHGQLEVMEVTMDAGQASAPEPVRHAGEECLVILRGRGALEFGDSVIDLRADDAATFPGPIPHRLRNTGRGQLRVLSIITPPSF